MAIQIKRFLLLIWNDQRKYNFANLLTLVRMAFIIPSAVILLDNDQKFSAGCFLVLAGLTDWLDGYCARHCGCDSPSGKLLDAIADKMILLPVIMLVRQGISGWVIFFILFREFIIVFGGFIFYHDNKLQPATETSRLGKFSTVILYASVAYAVFGFPRANLAMSAAAVCLLISGTHYIVRLKKIIAAINFNNHNHPQI